MSLIVTSSKQAEQYGRIQADGRTRQQIGIEKSSNYKNHFTVPLKIPADAEIAVESVKMRRGALFDIMDDALLWRYFGNLHEIENGKLLNGDFGGPMSMPIPIRPSPGTYTIRTLATELQDKFNRGYQNPELWNNSQVKIISNASGDPTGLSIAQRQRGSASGSDRSTTIEESWWRNPYQYSVADKTQNASTGLQWTKGIRTLKRLEPTSVWDAFMGEPPTGYNVKLDDLKGSSILTLPIGLVEGKVTYNMPSKGASNYRYGLSRAQLEYKKRDKIYNLYPGVEGNGIEQDRVGPGAKIINGRGNTYFQDFAYVHQHLPGLYQADYYDYMVEIDDAGEISLFQNVHDPGTAGNEDQFVRKEVIYYGWNASAPSKLTSTSAFPTWDRLTFELCGDEVVCYFHQAFSTGRLYLSNSNTTTLIKATSATSSSRADRCFAPINECRHALYPKVTIGDENGEVVISKFESHYTYSTFPGGGGTDAPNFMNASNYRFPVCFDQVEGGGGAGNTTTQNFVTGDDFYSNNRVPRIGATAPRLNLRPEGTLTIIRDYYGRQYSLDQTFICDTKAPYSYWYNGGAIPQNYHFVGMLGAGHGIAYEQALIVGDIGDEGSATNDADYFQGRYATELGVQGGTLARTLGFGELAYLVESDTDGTTPAYISHAHSLRQVFFNAVEQMKFKTNSCFVRLPRLTLTSFNGAKSSVSKIVYQVPKFSNEGREIGDLYFAPGEKTYVKLENTESFLMNNLEVQLVDVEEKVIDDLEGPTIIVFHVRKSRQ